MEEFATGILTTVAGVFLAKAINHLWLMLKWSKKLSKTQMHLEKATNCHSSLLRLKQIQHSQRPHYRTNQGMKHLEERCNRLYLCLVSHKEEIEILVDEANAHQSYPSQKLLDKEVGFGFHSGANNLSRYQSHIERTSNLRQELLLAEAFFRRNYQNLYHSNRLTRIAGAIIRKKTVQ